MCNCLKDAESKIVASAKEEILKREKISSIAESGFTNKGLLLDGKGNGYVFILPFEMQYIPEKQNGLASRVKKTYRISMKVNFCPLCGADLNRESIKEPQETFSATEKQKSWLNYMAKGIGIKVTGVDKLNAKDQKEMDEMVKWGYCKEERTINRVISYYIPQADRERVIRLLHRWKDATPVQTNVDLTKKKK
jgi:hypothetical protein